MERLLISNEKKEPFIFFFSQIGNPSLGYISVAGNSNLPFEPKRVYWTYFTPNNVERGNHAHKELEQIIIAVSGSMEFDLESIEGKKFKFILDNPNKALYIPKKYWRVIRFSHNSVLLCLASLEYDKDDYIREYNIFKKNTSR